MGLLTDLSLAPMEKITPKLTKHGTKVCFLFYIAGLAWFMALAQPELNRATYLSENSLLPGLVYLDMGKDSSQLAQKLMEELQREQQRHKSTPYSWIFTEMQQIGLETHVHNFTFKSPFSGGKVYHGKNIYGILRAPRISSTEGIVISVPYRPKGSVQVDISASVPVLLAFAEFARKKNYWAKDLIFLVTEQEQLGIRAWLEAYYAGDKNDTSLLRCGNLPARAGVLQAALNLEVQDLDTDYINVKIEGLNGQLPNLDLFNLVQRIAAREGVSSGYKHTTQKKRSMPKSDTESNLKNMIAMLLSQTTGVPNGNHGLFHQYRIESVTLEAVKRTSTSSSQRSTAALPFLKVMEGISRSLNNLLERFHQSYFSYILVQNDRFVSIGDYMPSLGLLVFPIFLKALMFWLTIGQIEINSSKKEDYEEFAEKKRDTIPYGKVFGLFGISICIGGSCNLIPVQSCESLFFINLDGNISSFLMILLSFMLLIALLLPIFVSLNRDGMKLLGIGGLLSLGVAIIVLGVLNFAFSFLVAVITVPFVILMPTDLFSCGAMRTILYHFYMILLNPLVVSFLSVFIYTFADFCELPLNEMIWHSAAVTKDAITYALLDRVIYNNWLYTISTAVFFPIWIIFYVMAFSAKNEKIKAE